MNDCSVGPFKITGRLYGPINEALIKIDFDGFLLHRRHVYLLPETNPECSFAQASSHGVRIASPNKDLYTKHVTLEIRVRKVYLFQNSQDDGCGEQSFIRYRSCVVQHWDKVFEAFVMITI